MGEIEDRLAALEQRLERIERAVKWGPAKAEPKLAPIAQRHPRVRKIEPLRKPLEAGSQVEPSSAIPQILGISGVAAFILAASYLVRLAIDSGWLTPLRQIAIAATAGVSMIAGGLWLRASGRRYASLLSAAGVVVCFLTIFSAHLLFGFIGPSMATTLIAALCLLALWLGWMFDTRLYAFIAVLGAYATPFLVRTETADVVQLVQYYSAWSLLFCAYSIWIGGRHAYLVASVLAVVGFDLAWRNSPRPFESWQLAALYQASQFLLFTATTAFYSAKYRAPLSGQLAVLHAPSLFFFYVIEYSILDRHIPEWAPWISLATALVVSLAYLLAKPRLASATAGATLVNWYLALALFHAGYIELLPSEYEPWVALGLFVFLGAARARFGAFPATVRPLLLSAAVVGFLNYIRVLGDIELDEVPLLSVLYIAYALVLYLGYAIGSKRSAGQAAMVLLYAGHVSAMVAVERLVETSVLVSVLWGSIAIGSLLLAVRKNNRVLAQSSFLVFIASGVKVMVFDLEDSSTLVKIGCLVVLGATLYAGGWLYQRLDREAT